MMVQTQTAAFPTSRKNNNKHRSLRRAIVEMIVVLIKLQTFTTLKETIWGVHDNRPPQTDRRKVQQKQLALSTVRWLGD